VAPATLIDKTRSLSYGTNTSKDITHKNDDLTRLLQQDLAPSFKSTGKYLNVIL
jgi:hypothetical protein